MLDKSYYNTVKTRIIDLREKIGFMQIQPGVPYMLIREDGRIRYNDRKLVSGELILSRIGVKKLEDFYKAYSHDLVKAGFTIFSYRGNLYAPIETIDNLQKKRQLLAKKRKEKSRRIKKKQLPKTIDTVIKDEITELPETEEKEYITQPEKPQQKTIAEKTAETVNATILEKIYAEPENNTKPKQYSEQSIQEQKEPKKHIKPKHYSEPFSQEQALQDEESSETASLTDSEENLENILDYDNRTEQVTRTDITSTKTDNSYALSIASEDEEDEDKDIVLGEYDPELSDALSQISDFRAYCLKIKDIPLLDDEETAQHFRLAKKGDTNAFHALVYHNLRLVISIAVKYKTTQLSINDLVGEGNIGLIKAIRKFDPEQDTKLSTYATYWIRQDISRAIANYEKTIRIPVGVNQEIAKTKKTSKQLEEELNRKPAIEEIAEKSGLTMRTVERAIGIENASSLDFMIGENSELSDVVASDSMTESRIEREELHEEISKALDRLSNRERCVIEYRFGLGGKTKMALEKIGEVLGVTKERIRQIEEKALRKLRNPEVSRGIRPFVML